MILRKTCLTMAAIFGISMANTTEAATVPVSYWGSYGEPGWFTGTFSGRDLNGDNQISIDELTSWTGRYEIYSSGGQVDSRATRPDSFLFTVLPGGKGMVATSATFSYRHWFCGYPQEPCWVYEFSFPGAPLWEWLPLEDSIETGNVSYMSAVPLPGGLPLIAGGIGALAIMRRRQKVNA